MITSRKAVASPRHLCILFFADFLILRIADFHRGLFQLPGFYVYLRPSECDIPNLKEHSDGGTVYPHPLSGVTK